MGLAPREGFRGMSIQNPLWLIVLAAIPPLVIVTVGQLRRRSELLTPGRAAAFLGLRITAILCLVLGLAGLALARLSDRLSIVFLLDQSRSVSAEQRERALQLVETIRGKLGRGDSAALVRFGGSAQSEMLEAGVPVSEEGSDVDTGATNIGAALQDGLAQAGTGAAPRIVLLTDGNENRGSADAAAAVARSMGARIFPVPLGTAARGVEVDVDEVRAPARVRQAEPHEVTVMVRCRTAVTARVTLLRDAGPVAARVESLAPGENAVQFTGSFPERGLHAWAALVEAPGDGIPQNNHNRLFVEVTGAPQVRAIIMLRK